MRACLVFLFSFGLASILEPCRKHNPLHIAGRLVAAGLLIAFIALPEGGLGEIPFGRQKVDFPVRLQLCRGLATSAGTSATPFWRAIFDRLYRVLGLRTIVTALDALIHKKNRGAPEQEAGGDDGGEAGSASESESEGEEGSDDDGADQDADGETNTTSAEGRPGMQIGRQKGASATTEPVSKSDSSTS